MRLATMLLFTIGFSAAVALANEASAPSSVVAAANENLVVVEGIVRREPATQEGSSAPPRYRERRRARVPEDEGNQAAGCACNPGLFAVVQLVSDDLPPLKLPLHPPAMAQKERRFEPSVIAVPVGGTVEFPNHDPFFHNVFSYSKVRKFDLGRYPEGKSAAVTFDEAGVVPVFCEIHYSMRAYVHVVETPYYAVTDEHRRFRIPDVRPGDYTLRVWQEGLPEIERRVLVLDESVWIDVE